MVVFLGYLVNRNATVIETTDYSLRCASIVDGLTTKLCVSENSLLLELVGSEYSLG